MPASCSVMILVSRSRRWRSRASRSGGLAEPPAELCDKVRAAADRLLAGTPLRSDGKLTILSLAQEAGIKRWLLTHKYPHQLKDKYQAEFRAAGHKSQPVQTAEQETARLRTELGKARAEQRRLTELNQTYAAIINQLADDLAQATAERDTLTAAGSVTRITTRHQVPPSG
jgi:hypothetical protein